MKDSTVRQVMREMGRKGGKRRLETMTANERKEIARRAAEMSARVRRGRKELVALSARDKKTIEALVRILSSGHRVAISAVRQHIKAFDLLVQVDAMRGETPAGL